MQSMEFPLVLFTVLSQAAVGMTIMEAVRPATGPEGEDARQKWRMVAGLMVVGLIASLFHLGHPARAVTALAHLAKAWLSREVLFAGGFAGLALFAAVGPAKLGRATLAWVGTVLGLAMLFSTGMTYAPPGPACLKQRPAHLLLPHLCGPSRRGVRKLVRS